MSETELAAAATTDIVDEMEAYRASLRQTDVDHEGPLSIMLGSAIAEIKHLRLLAGKVSTGYTFADLKRYATHYQAARETPKT